MKKILFLLLAVSPVVLPAEEMKFVTTLSQPVGSFARVEAVNANRPAQALQVNFCNNKVSSGNISVNGAVRAAYLKLDNTGSLGGNVPVYQLKTLNLGSNKTFEGGNVWANEANPAKVKADGKLYGKDMSYLVAELPALKITNTANIKRGGPTGEDLEWGAQYTCDYIASSATGETTWSDYVYAKDNLSSVCDSGGVSVWYNENSNTNCQTDLVCEDVAWADSESSPGGIAGIAKWCTSQTWGVDGKNTGPNAGTAAALFSDRVKVSMAYSNGFGITDLASLNNTVYSSAENVKGGYFSSDPQKEFLAANKPSVLACKYACGSDEDCVFVYVFQRCKVKTVTEGTEEIKCGTKTYDSYLLKSK